MTIPTENKNWIIDKGDEIINKKTAQGMAILSDWEKLVYCLWVADYGMRNAGDLQSAADVYENYKSEAMKLARTLRLPVTKTLFSMNESELEKEYFAFFDAVCNEVRNNEFNK